MAKKISDAEHAYLQRKKARYPWDQWTTGEVFVLERGVDYLVPDESMRINVLAHARRRGLTVTTGLHQDGLLVHFGRPPVTDDESFAPAASHPAAGAGRKLIVRRGLLGRAR